MEERGLDKSKVAHDLRWPVAGPDQGEEPEVSDHGTGDGFVPVNAEHFGR